MMQSGWRMSHIVAVHRLTMVCPKRAGRFCKMASHPSAGDPRHYSTGLEVI